ncbi:Anaphase-promoting complex subunit 1 [Wickerhamomyces ciferrii]|uniref:Anaphase-promoting complex subunit 1 n=1 Tax=Wickerhamomyces ciferrii (strain ATCC 14091 / BCRC 22168 / CBS 111 / JCM 3599 / NBRC 0793 / NRRL Y-1031 F-60-10) TaxID=1206466 RepID=K0KFQ1_WICCF|nr:Anaphase-promoting complex subunit 1 [Wickerhamomyces ciferrii]CCH41746.1 Anaphase-promoting complex subunit 1 [Wickerhamomyces ciferrii]
MSKRSPSIVLKDVKFESDLSRLLTNQYEARVSLSSNEMLVIENKQVLWFKGDLLSRKLLYDKKVVNAFFTSLITADDKITDTQSPCREKVMMVFLEDSLHIYYEDGRSYSLSFSFIVQNALSQENGAVIERSDSSLHSFVTLTEPLAEFGSIVSSSTTSISSDERLISFPSDTNHSISATFDVSDTSIKIYHTRFLSRISSNTPSTTSNSIRRKASVQSRKPSQTLAKDESTENQPSEILIEKKRSISHSGVLSIDRMTSYDYSNNGKAFESNGSSPSGEILRKDAILTKIDHLDMKTQSNLEDIITESIIFGNKEAIIIQNLKIGVLEILIFEKNEGAVSSSRFLQSISLTGDITDYSTTSHQGTLILISKLNEFVLFNPFLDLKFHCFKPSTQINRLLGCNGSKIIAETTEGKLVQYNMILKPTIDAIERCMSSLKYLVNSYTYNYLHLCWVYSYALLQNEWDAFVLTILAALIPMSVSPSDVDANNPVSKLLLKINILQEKALEDQFTLKDMAPNIILALHILREDFKLNVLDDKIVKDLGLLLSQLTLWMSWSETWYSYYGVDQEILNRSIKFPQFQILENPPDVMQSLTSLFEATIVPYVTFSQLAQESEHVDELVIPRTFYILRLFEAILREDFTPKDIVNLITEYNITKSELDTYPIGIIIPLNEAIALCQEYVTNEDTDLIQSDLVDRKDLKMLISKENSISSKTVTHNSSGQQQKDVHQIISTINDTQEPVAPAEYDRFSIVKLIFSEDRRFYEVSKMLQTSKIQALMTKPITNVKEDEIILKQRDIALIAYVRTLTVPLGRSSLLYSSKFPLVTEKFLAPKISPYILLQPDNVTINVELDKVYDGALSWGNFHNGASTGLTVSRDAKGISGSWIVFNKPNSLTAQHGGFLLGLGINGHLKTLEEYHIFNFLGPKHPFTSIGLLLGMSASLKSTMDVKLTKVLSVHVVALLPHGATDMIIPVSVQTAGLIGIGLLYAETQHRRMSEIMLSQITGKVLLDDKEVSDESYRLAAGFALGYINLGRGDDLKGLNESHISDKLLEIATSMKDVQSEDALDKSMSGALVGLALIYLKSDNDIIARKIKVPEAEQFLDYIRPDIITLRSLCYFLIMWSSIGDSRAWVEDQIPEWLLPENLEDGIDGTPYYYILSGICMAMSLKYASSSNKVVRDTIIDYYDDISRELDDFGVQESFGARLKKSALMQAQIILALSASIVMAATGDIEVLRRLRVLHGILEVSNSQNSFGKYMAANMAIGFLFLGGGQYAFNTSNDFGVAALLTSIYPLFPNCSSADPEVHLQALRHFWALASEPRCLVIRDAETLRPINSPVLVTLKDGQTIDKDAPCLLPNLSDIERIDSVSDEYHKVQMLELSGINNYLDVFVYRKRKIEVMKKSVELILSEINSKFEAKHPQHNKLLDLCIFDRLNKYDVQSVLEGTNETEFGSNIIDKQVELTAIVKKPKNIDDLWNLKLIFAYYDKILSDEDTHYLSIDFVDNLRIQLWSLMSTLQ